uniref:Uncharacterized protein n=1 Tax=Parascaris equorum TaxID=6256 RepID=A0A914RHS6_PAREQ
MRSSALSIFSLRLRIFLPSFFDFGRRNDIISSSV